MCDLRKEAAREDSGPALRYLDYWGLNGTPFSLSPDPAMLYLSKQHRECLIRLKFAIYSGKGGALLVSENAGDGKTSVLRRLIEDLKEELRGGLGIAFIDHPSLTPNQMVQEICGQLGVRKPARNRYESLNQLKNRLKQLDRQGIKCLIIVDEGQLLASKIDTLQELRTLLNFCLSDRFLLTFILSGQKLLEEVVKDIPEFYQRLPVRFFLDSLDRPDTEALIRFRLKKVGLKNENIFSPDSYQAIFRYSQGCPRVICSLSDLCLLIGYSMRRRQLDSTVVERAQSDMVSSEEGFHYFKFLRSEEESAEERKSRNGVL